ncbi:helix-turn-helix domain-containing protein [Candidatus Viridilinea mediisalina]|nr:helix-turn-helix transcriptional regulator [Candidatus Viridilinea mediisalina]
MQNEALTQRLGRRLRTARFAAGLTVREAAARAGLPGHTQLVRYENGRAQPPLERLAALASAYGTTLSALLALHDEAVALIAVIERADESTLRRLLGALE